MLKEKNTKPILERESFLKKPKLEELEEKEKNPETKKEIKANKDTTELKGDWLFARWKQAPTKREIEGEIFESKLAELSPQEREVFNIRLKAAEILFTFDSLWFQDLIDEKIRNEVVDNINQMQISAIGLLSANIWRRKGEKIDNLVAEYIEADIKKAVADLKRVDELYGIIDRIAGLLGAEEFDRLQDLKTLMGEIGFKNISKLNLEDVPEDYGLRKKVAQLLKQQSSRRQELSF